MGGIRQTVVALMLCASAYAGAASAHEPNGPGLGLPSFARLELSAVQPSVVAAHDRGMAPALLNGADNATLLERTPSRDLYALTLRYALTPWLSLDFAHGMLHREYEADGNPLDLSTRVFDQAGATLYPARGWNASLFVNFFKMDTTTEDAGVRGANASFVNARVNHDLSRNTRLSFDLLNVFDKRITDVDPLATNRLWSDPLIAENVLFDASESRAFRLRLSIRFR